MGAIGQLNKKSSRMLFLPHNEVIIIGRSQAQLGVKPYLDFFRRNNETRMDVRILVADETAKDILSLKPEQEKINAAAISRMMENEMHKSKALSVNLLDFTSRLIDKTTSPVAPIIKAAKTAEEESGILMLTGMAIFKEDRLVGELDDIQTVGYAMAMGEIKGGSLCITTPLGDAALGITKTECKSNLVLRDDGSVEVSLAIDATLTVEEIGGFSGMKMPEVLPLLEQVAGNVINEQVTSCFVLTRQLNTDIYGFGAALHRKYPGAWKTMEPNWDQIYPTITLSVATKAAVTGTGEIVDSLDMKEGQP